MDKTLNNKDSLLPYEFFTFIRVSAIAGFIAALVLTTAIAFKLVNRYMVAEKTKKIKKIIIAADLIIFFVFLYIFLVLF